ncbi:uncharacterized protein LOC132394809 [Hypanus sabinus]|uniref:uncharacterized protein LOC132394809 n=1 Tax=Hypanus sabinus TaxID=79690 RepID=UPI0028C388BF|nr:uncharacterized protein LOC132394809 [Hypanus sabinus]
MSSLHITLLHFPLGSSVSRCADPPLLSVRQRTGSVSRSRSGTDRSGRGVDRMSVGHKNRQPPLEKFMSLLSLRIFSLVRLFSLLLQLGVVGAEAEREEVVGVLGSSVLLDPEITVDSSKNDILWTFKASNKSHDVILDHVPGIATLEQSEQFKDRLQFNALSGALTISRLNASDQGDYIFTVDEKELKIMELLVIDKVKEEVGLFGSSVFLDPELKVDPSKSEIVWMFIDRSILRHVPGHSSVELSEQFKFRLQFNTSNGALTVNEAEHGDQGDYTFIVDGQELRIIQLRLVDKLPEASIFTNTESLGFTVELTCDVFGDLNVYQWQKNGGEISQHHQLTDENRTLVIPSASFEDCGVYTCITTNPVSSIQTNYTLMLQGLSLKDVILIAVLAAGQVISGPSLHSAVLLDQWGWKTLGGCPGYFLILWICNTLSLIAMYIVFVYWSVVGGLSPLDSVVICVLIVGLQLSSYYINALLYVTKIREFKECGTTCIKQASFMLVFRKSVVTCFNDYRPVTLRYIDSDDVF